MDWVVRFIWVSACFVSLAWATIATLSNIHLPLDTNHQPFLTGEASVLVHDGVYYAYFNNWGGCPGVNCCDDHRGCATCCFSPPSIKYPDACVYTKNHTVVGYKTTDFIQWENMGVVLPLTARLPGIEFRPHVVYNKNTNRFVMWYEDRHAGQSGYAVAVSGTPEGPFVTIKNDVKLPGSGRIGDFDVFVDEDGVAYHVRTGFDIVRLDVNYTGGTSHVASFKTPKASEGPVMFKRQGRYYIMPGTGCCACIGGSTIYVLSATNPLGPYTFHGDVGSNPTPFDPHSPHNYVTRAQASAVFPVPSPSGEVQYVWLGNQWVTATEPGHPRNRDLLYWYVVEFSTNGTVQQFKWQNTTTITV